MMKLVLTLTLTLITASSTFSQEKITVEKIWKTYEYYGASLNGFRSMNDGNFFSKITSSETGESVTKHSFEDREGEGEVLIPESVLAKLTCQIIHSMLTKLRH